jgi:hypothetical protein
MHGDGRGQSDINDGCQQQPVVGQESQHGVHRIVLLLAGFATWTTVVRLLAEVDDEGSQPLDSPLFRHSPAAPVLQHSAGCQVNQVADSLVMAPTKALPLQRGVAGVRGQLQLDSHLGFAIHIAGELSNHFDPIRLSDPCSRSGGVR